MSFEQGRIALRRALAQHWFRNEDDTEIGYKAAREWYLGELGEPPGLADAYALGKKLLTWKPHVCSGERVDNGRREYYECDDADSPRCPSHQPVVEDERCSRCDVRKFAWVRIGGRNDRGWYCEPCWYERGYT